MLVDNHLTFSCLREDVLETRFTRSQLQ